MRFIFNRLLAVVLVILSLPVQAVIGVIIRLKYGSPVFYRGERLGLNKKPFIMYKFRTLPVDAQKKIGARILSPEDFKLPWFSRFLRDTRLDELPQLFNILKGDMDFVGPRPLRPEIYEKYCRHIPDVDLRFKVKPGLIGYSQLYTPHSAPKRIRALIDNRFVKSDRSLLRDLTVIVITVLIATYKLITTPVSDLWKRIKGVKEKRAYRRIRLKNAFLELCNENGYICLTVKDINEKYICVEANCSNFMLKEGRLVVRENGKRKTASVKLSLERQYIFRENGVRQQYLLFRYAPKNDFSRYVVDKYFLKKAFAGFFFAQKPILSLIINKRKPHFYQHQSLTNFTVEILGRM